ncbi:hypothetical protein KDK82_3004 [Delftia sp. K82]|uniref:GNAT family N-acetyltransferase n=1 Tax=Delftia sp. K82 TaxID=1472718 RepID=UPI000B75FE0E|nr:GNAT family protein [Delftia sp. K82]OWG19509.1 hypothetical protein KDK82_3004 [Delftia sp. K82]
MRAKPATLAGMLDYDTPAIYTFLRMRIPGLLSTEGAVGIGWKRGGVLVAGAVFEQHNGRTVWAHVAIDAPLSRRFLRAFLDYPFAVCAVDALRGYVLASNTRLRALARRLGAVEEAVLAGAARDGGDVVVCTLWRGNLKHDTLAQH